MFTESSQPKPCPKCGFMLDPTMTDCPRCARQRQAAMEAARQAALPKAEGSAHTLGLVASILILVLDGLVVLWAIYNLAFLPHIFESIPKGVRNTPEFQAVMFQTYLLINVYLLAPGALRVLGAIGFLKQRQWCAWFYLAAFIVDLLIAALLISRMLNVIIALTMWGGGTVSPGEYTAEVLRGYQAIAFGVWAVARLIPAFIVRGAITADWDAFGARK